MNERLRCKNVYFNGSLLNYEDVVVDNMNLFTTFCGRPIQFFVDVTPLLLRRELELFIRACGGDIILDSWLITKKTVLIAQTSNLQSYDRPVFSPQYILHCLEKRELLDLTLYVQNGFVSGKHDFMDIVFRKTGNFLGVVHLQWPELEESEKVDSLCYIQAEVDNLRQSYQDESMDCLRYSTIDASKLDNKLRQSLKNRPSRNAHTRGSTTSLRPELNFEELVDQFELYLEMKKGEKLRQFLNALEEYCNSHELIHILNNAPAVKEKLMEFSIDDGDKNCPRTEEG